LLPKTPKPQNFVCLIRFEFINDNFNTCEFEISLLSSGVFNFDYFILS